MNIAEAGSTVRKYGVALTPQMVTELDRAAKRETTSRSHIVRLAVRRYLQEHTQQEKQDEQR